ncbi:hypothetical protein IFM89_039811 [Coptis chinensis]|uniref:KRR-R motif-containing protein 1 n=1 Tax=Coptis chinensis TaxID=261450 RepID=A0A835GTU8_9MAGN|nr:hypothetical protein IFM89_039811 [Coptis chinensis]
MEDVKNMDMEGVVRPPRYRGKHDKPKPWDDESIDHWKVEKFDPSWNESGLLVTSSFATLFPAYREVYLQEVSPIVKAALKPYGISFDLNMVEGTMTVSTTLKTRDPYIIVKAKELIRLLSRSVPAPQAIKILDDEMQCDIIRIGGLVRSKERFIKRRQLLLGSNSSTLKAIEILTNCYVLVQGNTVAAMGSFKGLKQVRRVVEDCIQNKLHPLRHIKEMMVKRELGKRPELATENWDRFLPKFKKKNVQKKKAISIEKKPYTPFPPPQPPSKIDLQLESGEYFLNDKKKSAKKWQEKQEQQAEKSAENKRKRDAAFLPPEEHLGLNSSKFGDGKNDVTDIVMSLKKKAKDLGTKKAVENVNAEDYIVAPAETSSKKKTRYGLRQFYRSDSLALLKPLVVVIAELGIVCIAGKDDSPILLLSTDVWPRHRTSAAAV